MADQLATQAVLRYLPSAACIAKRLLRREQLGLAQRLMAEVQTAALAEDHQARAGAGARVPRRWGPRLRARRRRQQQMPRADAGDLGHASARAVAPGPLPPEGLHEVYRVGQVVRCRRCGKEAGRGRWHLVLWTPCRGPEGSLEAAWQWQRVAHVLCEAEGWARCVRCMGQVPMHRKASMQGRRCPAWLAVCRDERAEPGLAGWDWGAILCRRLQLRVAGLPARPAGALRLAGMDAPADGRCRSAPPSCSSRPARGMGESLPARAMPMPEAVRALRRRGGFLA